MPSLASGLHCRKRQCSTPTCLNVSSKGTRWCYSCRVNYQRKQAKPCSKCKNTAIPHMQCCRECRCSTSTCGNLRSHGKKWCWHCRDAYHKSLKSYGRKCESVNCENKAIIHRQLCKECRYKENPWGKDG